MTEQAAETTTETTEPAQEPDTAAETTTEDSTDWKAEARKWEQRAKENRAAAAELEKQRKASMSEAEKAVAEAEERGRTAAASEFGKRLARTEFDAVAGRRNPDFDTASALEYVDLGKFVGEDGEPDTKAIKAAVERLVPEPANGAPSFDGGTRTTAPAPQGMSQIIRKAAGRA
jgi:hypothetical protein